MKYRKKPIAIEAVRIISIAGGAVKWGEVAPPWLEEACALPAAVVGSVWPHPNGVQLLVGTLESPHEANPGDWIIRGVKGELYPCKPDIFAATYELANAPTEGIGE